jgi:putative inorganic carbon (hco3(-)) transporter
LQRIKLDTIMQTLVIVAYLALITFLPSLHLGDQKLISYHDSQRMLELILIAAILICCALNELSWAQVIHVNHKVRIGIYLIFALASLSTLLSHTPRHAVIEISIFGGLSYLALLVVSLYQENKQVFLTRLCYALLASILLYLISFYVGYITAILSKTPLSWPKPFSGFTNIRSFNQYQLWSLGLIYLPLLNFELKQNLKRGLLVALSFWWILLFYSASRGVLLAWLFAILITWFVYQKSAWSFLRLQFIGIATGFLGYHILFNIIPATAKSSLVTGSILRQTTSDRTDLWGNALTLIHDHPLLGVGPMHYPWYNTSLSHPHNSVLQLAAEWGLPATLIILAIAGYTGYCWLMKFNANKLKDESKSNCNLVIILFFTIAANAAYSLVDGVIVMPISQVLMATIIGLMIAVYTGENKANTSQKSIASKTKSAIAVTLLIAIVWSTLPEIREALSGSEKRFSMGYTAAGPRIWWEVK